MASHKYRITVDGEAVETTIPGARQAQRVCRAELAQKPAGTKGFVERCVDRATSAPWLPFRAYVIHESGIITRTDRTPDGKTA